METGLGQSQISEKLKTFVDPNSGDTMVSVDDVLFPPKKVWIKTFGCQMNYHDTERMLSHLKKINYSQTEAVEDADLVLFNTCAVRDLSNNKFYSHLGEMKKRKKNAKELLVGIGGCVAQTEGKDLIKKYKYLDFSFGTDNIDSINDYVYQAKTTGEQFFVNKRDRSDDFSIETKVTHGSPQAFVNIIKGCNKYCSYCIVPYTRGKERSRKIAEVVADIQNLVENQGIQEVTLLGQNVNSFGKENSESLAQLITELEKIEKLKLLRYTTSHPYDVSDELIKVHGTSTKLAPQLHLPVQSGSNSVLKKMYREYSVEHYLDLVKKLKEAKPGIVLSTDIIVGFPNETEIEFQETLDLLTAAQFDSIFSYVYSPRANTPAEKLVDDVTKEEKKSRLHRVHEHQLKIQADLRAKMVGNTYKVLVEGKSSQGGVEKWKGRTSCNRIVHFSSPREGLKWKWVDLEILSATSLSCQGKLV
jgi:tRNA-2-methylthio-N6-dimethylallyladenosine synthase